MSVNLKSLIGKLNETTRTALEVAAGLCLSRTHYEVEIEHYLVKLLDASNSDLDLICRHFDVDVRRLAEELSRTLDGLKTGNTKTPVLSPTLVDMFREAWLIGSINFNAYAIRSGFTVLALLESHTFHRLVRDSVPQLSKIDTNLLEKDFEGVLNGSIETASLPTRARSEVARVFINYRRDDTASEANALFYRLLSEGIKVFRDTETLKPGMKFEQRIKATVGECDVLLALIGKNWLTATDDEGQRRLDNEHDWVRLEIAEALRQGKKIIPCLVNGARIPRRQELPPDLQELAAIHCLEITLQNFPLDTGRLLEVLRSV